ncbi:MAG: glycosyltransferase family 2 protein [Rhodothermales bacterium]
MGPRKCSVVIVSYNTFELTKTAIDTALQAGGGSVDVEVIVVDNDSPDGSASRLAAAFPPRQFPSVSIVAQERNTGFSAANNKGASLASGSVLFFLNPDTIVHDNAIELLYNFIESRTDVGAVGPLVLNTDGTIQASISSFVSARSIIRSNFSFLFGPPDEDVATPRSVDIVKGCALAISREVFDKVGGWDESIFMYSEETLLCRNVAERGHANFFLPSAVVTHIGGASTADTYANQQVVAARSFLDYLRRQDRRMHLVWLFRVTGAIGFAVRSVGFAVSRRLVNVERRIEHQRRGDAARRLLRWFLLEFD